MNKEKRNALLSIVFYVVSMAVIVIINVLGEFKSGVCTPNLDALSVVFLILLNVVLLLFNGVLAFILKKETKYSFVVHLIVFMLWILTAVAESVNQ